MSCAILTTAISLAEAALPPPSGLTHPVRDVGRVALKQDGDVDAAEWGGAAVFAPPTPTGATWRLGWNDQALVMAMSAPLPAREAKPADTNAPAATNAPAVADPVVAETVTVDLWAGERPDGVKAPTDLRGWLRGAVNARGQGILGRPGENDSWSPLPWSIASQVTNGTWELETSLAMFQVRPLAGYFLVLRLARGGASGAPADVRYLTLRWDGWNNVSAVELDPPAAGMTLPDFAPTVASLWRFEDAHAPGVHGPGVGWAPGRLDPARGVRTAAPPVDALRLEHHPLAPVYIGLERRGDPFAAINHPLDNFDSNRVQAPSQPLGININCDKDRPDVTLFVDFGVNFPGTLEFEANPPAGIEILIETGEALQPTRLYRTTAQADGSNHVFRPLIAHADWGSLRFAWIRFRGVNKERGFYVRRLRGLYQYYACPYEGAFACSDDTLTRVWDMCAYSAHTVMAQPVGKEPTPQSVLQTLCMDRGDRHPWGGDSRAIQATVGYVFGQYPLLRAAIEKLLPTGTRPIPDLQGIPGYTLDWAMGVVDYYRLSGDREYFLKRLPDLVAVLEKFDGPVPSSQGGYSMFFDWDHRVIPTRPENRAELEACFTGKYVQFGRELAWAAKEAGATDRVGQATAVADRHAAAWRKANPDWETKYRLHAISNLILGDLIEPGEYGRAFAAVYADRSRRWTESPYFTAYVMAAMLKIGRSAEALELARDYWGGMIATGATTVWEEWDPHWRLPVNAQPPQFERYLAWGGLSLNHPVGTTPARWLQAEVLGVKPLTPGFGSIRVQPHPCGLGRAQGAVATPFGAVKVEWTQANGKLDLAATVPTGIEEAEFVLPEKSHCVVNGRELAAGPAREGGVIYRVD